MFEQGGRPYASSPTPVKGCGWLRYRPVMTWRPGDAIALRERWGPSIFAARPATVVQDDAVQTMLYIPPGVLSAAAVDDAGVELRIPDRPWHLELREHSAFGVLSWAWPDTPYAVLFTHEPDGSPRGWYVNLQTPLARTPVGFDTVDHAIDVVIPLDRSSWSWKDEVELAEAVALGLFTEQDAAWFRHWGERGVEHVLLGQPPFDRDWAGWRPDPAWGPPELPHGWDVT